ncbi:MAG: helix-turn-helix domain-containing protein [Oscillospiraceae bacterium]|nr:helix-turn-helix domain-containing protein [Oscillospiraceae bacterium]
MDNTPVPSPGYWAVIPAKVRYDEQIPPNAKLLYAEISSLIGPGGYCWARNDYFCSVFGFSDRTVRDLLTALKDAGYIRIEERREQHKVLSSRKIYASINPLQGEPPPPSGSLLEDFLQKDDPEAVFSAKIFRKSAKIFQKEAETPYKKITNKNLPEESPRTSPRRTPECLPERFEAFWKFYRSIPGEGGQPRNEKRAEAVKAWDKLRPDDKLVDRIGRALQKQLRTADWRKGVGIPMAATYLNQRRWEDAEELPDEAELLAPAAGPNAPEPVGKDVMWV